MFLLFGTYIVFSVVVSLLPRPLFWICLFITSKSTCKQSLQSCPVNYAFRKELRDITRLILENPRMILFGKTLLKCVCYSFCDCFFVEEVDFSLCRMHVDIHRPWIDLQTKQTSAIFMRRAKILNLRYMKGEEPLGKIP